MQVVHIFLMFVKLFLFFDHLLELFDDLARVRGKAPGIAADDDVAFAVLALEFLFQTVGTLLGILFELFKILNHQAYTPAL